MISHRNRKGGSFRRTRMIPEEQNKALDAWQTSARYWDKYQVLIAQMFAPLTSGLVEQARIRIGVQCNLAHVRTREAEMFPESSHHLPEGWGGKPRYTFGDVDGVGVTRL